MSIVALPLPSREPGTRIIPRLGALLFVALAGCVLLGAAAVGLTIEVAGLAGAVALAWIAWRWPTQTAIALVVLIPMARFMSFAIYVPTHSSTLLRASQLWKDEVLMVLAARMVQEAFLRHRAPRVHLLDLLIVAFMALTAMYVVYPGIIPGSTYIVRGLAFRQDALYLLAYFVGRGLTLTRRDVRTILVLLVAMSSVIAAVALFEFIAPGLSNRIFDKLGYSAFQSALGTPFETASVRTRDLSTGSLPRASSLFLADLGLAFYQVLLIPVAAALFFAFRQRATQLWAGVFLILMIGTMGLTVARAPLAGGAVGLVLMVLVSRAFIKAAWVALAAAAMLILFLVVSGHSLSLVSDVYSNQDSSAAAHTGYINRSLGLVIAHPLGEGLGNGSHVSVLAKGLGQG